MNRLNHIISIWWGPPKNFEAGRKEKGRRISWLELFFDLVYVIAIARITHHLSRHLYLEGFLENFYLFALIFWGWLNGSFHHDLHGNHGLRTRLMMLWQMMIVAGLSILLARELGDYRDLTVGFMVLQLFITYQWWSVGVYDRSHRKYSWPYTSLFLLSFFLMGLSLVLPDIWLKIFLPLILILNYIPPFVSHRILVRSEKSLDLSSSMFERLGLFTIIIFGELVVGVVNGIGETSRLGFLYWLDFFLAMSVVFTLWWVFFVFVSERHVKAGFDKASILEILYIPALMSLGFIAASFLHFFSEEEVTVYHQKIFGMAVSVFLACIGLIMGLLFYPKVFDNLKTKMRLSLAISALAFLLLGCFDTGLSVTGYLFLVESLLLMEVAYLNYLYYSKLLSEGIDPSL